MLQAQRPGFGTHHNCATQYLKERILLITPRLQQEATQAAGISPASSPIGPRTVVTNTTGGRGHPPVIPPTPRGFRLHGFHPRGSQRACPSICTGRRPALPGRKLHACAPVSTAPGAWRLSAQGRAFSEGEKAFEVKNSLPGGSKRCDAVTAGRQVWESLQEAPAGRPAPLDSPCAPCFTCGASAGFPVCSAPPHLPAFVPFQLLEHSSLPEGHFKQCPFCEAPRTSVSGSLLSAGAWA